MRHKKADTLEKLVKRCATRIRNQLGSELPTLALVLGSGFDAVRQQLRISGSVSFAQLPGFPVTKVPGHAGELLRAELAGVPVLMCCGRSHFYEGLEMQQVAFPVRVLASAGIRDLVLTNAAGGISPRFAPGNFMLVADHINFTGVNPLRGMPATDGRCFVDLSEAYSLRLRKNLRAAARAERIVLREGIYLGVSGPTYETPAEIRAFRKIGADAVGMSTVPEVLMAKYCGLNVAAVSCITNRAAGLSPRRLSHRDVLATGRRSAQNATRLLRAFVLEWQATADRKGENG